MARSRAVWTAMAAALVFGLLVVSAARIMIGYDHNEQMYVTAGYLVARGQRLYRDFAFLQMPYLPLLYGAIFRVTQAQHLLLVARLLGVAAYVAAAALLTATVRLLSPRKVMALGVTALFLLNPTIVKAASEASNYVLPLMLSYAAFLLYVVGALRPRKSWLAVFAAGVALGAATGAKLYYAPIAGLFLAASAIVPQDLGARERLSRVAGPLLGGVLAGVLPALWYAVPDPGPFVFDNVGFHTLNAAWREMSGFAADMTLPARVSFAIGIIFAPANAVLLATAALLAALGAAGLRGRDARSHRRIGAAVLASALFAVSLVVAVAPRPIFPQYLAMPTSFLVLALGCWLALAARCRPRAAGAILAASIVITLLVRADDMRTSVTLASDPGRWPPVRLHAISESIRTALAARGLDGKVATLAPLYAAESDLAVYRELAAGPFLYRVGDLLTPAARARYVATSPDSVGALLDADPPAAVLVGFEGSLDDALREYARRRGYELVPGDWYRGSLYVRGASR